MENLNDFFTPEERLKIYESCFGSMLESYNRGHYKRLMCFRLIEDSMFLFPEKAMIMCASDISAMEYFPEFMLNRPNVDSNFWFPTDKFGCLKRVKTFENCISEVKKIIQNEQENKNK